MATPNRQTPEAPAQAALAQYLPLEKTYRDAMKLFSRFHQAQGFRQYLSRRAAFVVPMVALFVLVSVACTAATVIFLADRHALLALPGMMLAPFVLIGSLFVQGYMFLSWLEGRSLAKSLGHSVGKSRGKLTAWIEKHIEADLGAMPPVPWLLAAIFLLAPLVALAMAAPKLAIAVILLQILAPIAFARLDR